MAGDLEEFLKRAAERRAQKQQGAKADPAPAQPQRQPRPEYTSARRERQVQPQIEEAIPIAEIIEEPIDVLAEQRARVEEAKRKAAIAKAKMKAQRKPPTPAAQAPKDLPTLPTGNPAEQLLELIKRPGGMQQAFLLREVLERPDVDRW